ncbi:MAG: pyruvate formate lyase-activating protein [Clostridia bacterium]|nr:pyruvate formate lyase-activating protein [Clostridia bacterium]
MIGYLHSTESFGTVDGPGIRYVLFLQGCPLRCRYCHNPDTWSLQGGTPVTSEEILAEYRKNRAFYSKGGITATGGEPLLQIDFLIDLFTKAKAEGIHTCLDTSGITFDANDEEGIKRMDVLTAVTDLVMLDVKHIDPEKHRALTGQSNASVLAFARYLEERKVPLWVRHTVVPSLTDDPDDLFDLGVAIGTLTNLKGLDILPYHTLGVSKYRKLGIPYPLDVVPPLSKEEAARAKEMILRGIFHARQKNH